jgi:hypothetical protein
MDTEIAANEVPLAYIEEAITFAIANGWRPPVEVTRDTWRNAETIPAPDCDANISGAYDAVQLRHGLTAKLAVGGGL